MKKEFVRNAKKLLVEGHRKVGIPTCPRSRDRSRLTTSEFSGPFVLKKDNGSILMLPPDYIDAVNEQSGLSFREYSRKV